MGHILTNALGLTTWGGVCVCVCVCVCACVRAHIDVFLALFNMGGNHLLYMSHRNRYLDETKIISVH